MGIVNCANEQYGRVGALGDCLRDPSISQQLDREYPFGVYQATLAVLRAAEDENTTTSAAADELADRMANTPHPIFGHRSQLIIDSLLADNWAQ